MTTVVSPWTQQVGTSPYTPNPVPAEAREALVPHLPPQVAQALCSYLASAAASRLTQNPFAYVAGAAATRDVNLMLRLTDTVRPVGEPILFSEATLHLFGALGRPGLLRRPGMRG